MDVVRFGRSVRAVRIRRGWRQADLADHAGLARSVVGRIERGLRAGLTLDDVDAVAAPLDATAKLSLAWHGEALDRLLDEAHARLVEETVRRLRAWGWEVAVERGHDRHSCQAGSRPACTAEHVTAPKARVVLTHGRRVGTWHGRRDHGRPGGHPS